VDIKPHKLTPVEIKNVKIEDEFWSPKLKRWAEVTIIDCFTKFEKDGAFDNFDRVARGERGFHAGPPWFDGLIYEMIRAASDFLVTYPNPELEKRIDGYIERIAAAAAKDPNGYINTYTQLMEPTHRWGLNGGFLREQHDVYNAGALIEAGIHHYQATGKTSLLKVAVKLANHMCDIMGPPPKKNIVPAHSLPEEALVKLYLLFRDEPDLKKILSLPIDENEYLKLAEFWIENRGNHVGLPDWEKWDWERCVKYIRNQEYGDDRPSWGAYAQDHKPVLQQETIEGHAVRATLLCVGLIAAAMVNGRMDYYQAALRLWENMVHRRMYITGAVGAIKHDEKFGSDYVLPNDGHLETCAAVGAGFFHHYMNVAFADAKYADELERVLYNGILACVSLKGDAYFYQNPLEAGPNRIRWSWHPCPCCPPMFLKIMGSLPSFIYAYDDGGIYINLFIGSQANINLHGTKVMLKQITRYPWEGNVKIIVEPEKPSEFDLNIRIPVWCRSGSSPGGLYRWADKPVAQVKLKVNGQPVEKLEMFQGYTRLHRLWKRGDIVELEIPMPILRVRAHPKVKANAGRVALMRGPIVYCLESVDNPEIRNLVIPPDATMTAEYRADLLGGVTVIKGTALARVDEDSHSKSAFKRVEFTAIPYYANTNRGGVEMAVWIPEKL